MQILNTKHPYERPDASCLPVLLKAIVCASGMHDNSVIEDVIIADEYEW